MKYVKAISAFFAVQVACVYVMWMGGFDFDTRNFWTGYVAAIGLISGVFAASFAYSYK